MAILPVHGFPFKGDRAWTDLAQSPPSHPSFSPHPPPALQALDALNLGVLLATGRARVTFANRTAQAMLDRGPLTIQDGHVFGATPRATQDVRAVIAEVARGVRRRGFCRLAAPAGKQALLLTIVAADADPSDDTEHAPCVLIFVGLDGLRDAPPVEMMRAFFDLTPAEAKTAAEMIKGDGLKASARRLGVTPSTARTHLNRVFEKTGTRRQAELAALLMASCPIGTDRLPAPGIGSTAAPDIRMSRAAPEPCRRVSSGRLVQA